MDKNLIRVQSEWVTHWRASVGCVVCGKDDDSSPKCYRSFYCRKLKFNIHPRLSPLKHPSRASFTHTGFFYLFKIFVTSCSLSLCSLIYYEIIYVGDISVTLRLISQRLTYVFISLFRWIFYAGERRRCWCAGCFMYEDDMRVKNYINHNCRDELSVKLLVQLYGDEPSAPTSHRLLLSSLQDEKNGCGWNVYFPDAPPA